MMDEGWLEFVKAYGPSLVIAMFLTYGIVKNTREHNNASRERMKMMELIEKSIKVRGRLPSRWFR